MYLVEGLRIAALRLQEIGGPFLQALNMRNVHIILGYII